MILYAEKRDLRTFERIIPVKNEFTYAIYYQQAVTLSLFRTGN